MLYLDTGGISSFAACFGAARLQRASWKTDRFLFFLMSIDFILNAAKRPAQDTIRRKEPKLMFSSVL